MGADVTVPDVPKTGFGNTGRSFLSPFLTVSIMNCSFATAASSTRTNTFDPWTSSGADLDCSEMEGSSLIKRVITNLCESLRKRGRERLEALERWTGQEWREVVVGVVFPSLSVYREVCQGRASGAQHSKEGANLWTTTSWARQTASEVYFMLDYKTRASLCEGEDFYFLVFPLSTAALFCVWQVQGWALEHSAGLKLH